MKKILLLPFILVLFVFASCQGGNPTGSGKPTEDTVAVSKSIDVPWITGTWYMDMPEGHFEEEWKKINNNEWQATAVLRDSTGKITYDERKKMVYDGEFFQYYTTVKDLGEMHFVEKSRTANEIVFENKTNEYPQQVLYRNMGDSSMLSYIAGLYKGNRETYQWALKKK